MRILDLTTDSLLLSLDISVAEVVHCQTGKAVMHSGCPRTPPRFAHLRLLRDLLLARSYDWIILPPIHIDWTVSNSPIRRFIKKCSAGLIRFPRIAAVMRRVLFGSKTRLAVTDYSDQFSPSEFAITCLRPAHYFQLNIPAALVGKRIGPANTLVHYLPTVIQDDLIDSLQARSTTTRSHDIFIAGVYHNEQRSKQLEASKILTQRGWKVFELGERSFGQFSAGLLDSKLCFAGKGLAYHCFRPLEAAAAGAAPVWHAPEKGTYHDFVHGQNCFLYDPSMSAEEIALFVDGILRNPQDIEKVAQGALRLLNQRHRASALATHILEVLKDHAHAN